MKSQASPFEKTIQDALDVLLVLIPRTNPGFGFELRQELARTMGPVRVEERNRVVARTRGRQAFQGTSVHIDDVADGLKGEKRQSNGQHPLVETPSLKCQIDVGIGPPVGHEIRVFEHGQKRHVECHRRCNYGLPQTADGCVHDACQSVVGQHGSHQNEDQFSRDPGVKSHTESKEEDFAH